MKTLLARIECALAILMTNSYVAFIEKNDNYIRYTYNVDDEDVENIKGLEYEDCE